MPTSNARTIHCGSSLRAAPIDITLARAKSRATALGISRVSDITRLDRVGMPVYVSIRPGAQVGSLCVNAGKGLRPEEAQVGAYMESIEFALAEYNVAALDVVPATPRDVLDGHTRPHAILDFCPILGATIPLDARIYCVEAQDLLGGGHWLTPVELVFLPTPKALTPEIRCFGSSSNGLSSGNTLLEATVHGMAEVIERDVLSFFTFDDRSALILPTTLPPEANALAERFRAVGLDLYVRYQPNDFDLPWFYAVLVDRDERSPIFVNGGFGCHPHRDIALTRALCEAAQSRLGFIHGGRDDLTLTTAQYSGVEPTRLADTAKRSVAIAADATYTLDYEQVTDWTAQAQDLGAAYDVLTAALQRVGMRFLLRIPYTHPDDELQVVRVMVPGLENWTEHRRRIGPRLRDFIRRK
jgi:ribosomal protein S12 methylthiotransferase accessory factor